MESCRCGLLICSACSLCLSFHPYDESFRWDEHREVYAKVKSWRLLGVECPWIQKDYPDPLTDLATKASIEGELEVLRAKMADHEKWFVEIEGRGL